MPARAAWYLLIGMKRTPLRGLYSPELLEARIAPATIIVTSLLDDGGGADKTLREAIVEANDNILRPGADTITFDPAILPGVITLGGTEIVINGTLTIKGPGIDKLTIDGADTSRIFRIFDADGTVLHPATISGITFRDGNAADTGGAIYSSETLTLTNCVFFSNTAASSGGGVYVGTKGKVTVASCRFIDNTSGNEGGGLAVNAEGAIAVTRSIASGNVAGGGGGGFYLYGAGTKASTIKVDGCTILNNSATGASKGGGLIIDFNDESGKVSLVNTIISGNSGAKGGGLYLDGGRLTMNKCIFTQNTATDLGGAMAASGPGTLVIKNSRFEKNSAGTGGGALYLSGSDPATISGSAFVANTATTTGGAILGLNGVDLIVKTSTFSGNSATGNGGAIDVEGAGTTLVLSASTLSGNTGADGGGVFGGTGSMVTVNGGLFSGNKATSGGGGIQTKGDGADAVNLIVSGTTFTGNIAGDDGGGVYTRGDGTVFIKGVKAIGNYAAEEGGGMYLGSKTSVTVQSSLFQHNVADGNAGALSLQLSLATAIGTITGSKFLDNFSGGSGGGLYFGATGVAPLTIKGSLISGNVALTAGGGVFRNGGVLTILGPQPTGNWAPTDPNVSP